MKILLAVCFFCCFFSRLVSGQQIISVTPLLPFSCDSIPLLNQEILAFAETKMGKKVGNGDCWIFPATALNAVNANWDGRYKFGRKVNPGTDCLFPGDIIQFENVKVESVKNGGRFVEYMGPHTAIIYKVNGPGNYDLVHQNYGPSGRKVGVTNLELKNIKRGKIHVYRPFQ